MQSPEGGSDSAASVALHTSAPAQAPVVQPVPASQQRVLVQATGSAPKGAQMQQISVPRVQQVPQQVQSVQHVYPAQVQYVEGGEAVYTNGTIRAAYSYSSEAQIYAPASAAPYFEAQGGGGGGAQVTTAASSPTAIPSHNMVGITMDIGGSQILSGSGAYLIHGGLENSRHSLSHTSRSSPATVCSPAGTAARGPGMIPKGTEKPSENKTGLSLSLYMSVTCHVCKGENRHWCTVLVFRLVFSLSLSLTEIMQRERRLGKRKH